MGKELVKLLGSTVKKKPRDEGHSEAGSPPFSQGEM